MNVVVPPQLHAAPTGIAQLLRAVRAADPVVRDALTERVSASPATINRQLQQLIDSGLVTERTDLVEHGGIGRPRVPLSIATGRMVAGLHIGARRSLLALADLRGTVIRDHHFDTPDAASADPLAELLEQVRALLGDADPFWLGVATGGLVTGAGAVIHPVLGWDELPLGASLATGLRVPVSVANHIEAMAAAQALHTPAEGAGPGRGETTLFFYARETLGMATVVDGAVVRPLRGPGEIHHLPATDEELAPGATTIAGLLPDSVLAAAAERRGDEPGSAGFEELVRRRAMLLGDAIALIARVINPDHICIAGQGFTENEVALEAVGEAIGAAMENPPPVFPTDLGANIQRDAAIAVALAALYADPVAALEHA